MLALSFMDSKNLRQEEKTDLKEITNELLGLGAEIHTVQSYEAPAIIYVVAMLGKHDLFIIPILQRSYVLRIN